MDKGFKHCHFSSASSCKCNTLQGRTVLHRIWWRPSDLKSLLVGGHCGSEMSLSMESLKSQYSQLLGLDKHRGVASVELSVSAKCVTISLEYHGRGGVCLECKANCALKDHAPERAWRNLGTRQFETVLKARIPRVNCAMCGVKTISIP